VKLTTPYQLYALLLVVCLVAAAGCGRAPVDQLDLTTLLPAEPSWVVMADIPALYNWELWPELESYGFDRDGQLNSFFADAGIDPQKDLHLALVGLYPDGHPAGGFNAVLTGRFDQEKLTANLEQHGHRADNWREYTLLSAEGAGRHVVLFDETAIAITETRSGATAMIDSLEDGGASLHKHSRFGPQLALVDRSAPLWGSGLVDEDAMDGLESQLPVKGMIPSLTNLSFSLRIGTGLGVTCFSLRPDGEDAAQLATQLNGWLKLAAGLIQVNPRWFESSGERSDDTIRLVAETLDQAVVVSEGPVVRLEAAFSAELIRVVARAGSTSPGSPDPLPPGSTPAHP